MLQVTLDFEDGATYRYVEDVEQSQYLRVGTWNAPYPNHRYDSVVFGLIESWAQYPEGPIFGLLQAHGEPTKVVIRDVAVSDEEGVYRMDFYDGRAGRVEGVFTATAQDIERIIGQHIYFGEILGKHSEVFGILERNAVKLLSNDPDVVRVFKENNFSSGYNPFHYFERDDD